MVAGNVFYVPWPDFSEWKRVKEQLFSSKIQDTIMAYRTISMWKLKYDSLPAYIECTYSLLQVMIKEYEMTKTDYTSLLFNENDLQLSYSTALIRFVNHISSVSGYKGETLYFAAKTQNIPDWIINMRHDCAHGQNLPTLDALHVATELALKWLLDNYWGRTELCQQKVPDTSQTDSELVLENFLKYTDSDVQDFFKKFFEIWEYYHKANYIKAECVTEFDREFILLIEEFLSLHTTCFSDSEFYDKKELQAVVDVYNGVEKKEKIKWLQGFKLVLRRFIKNTVCINEELRRPFVLALCETTFLFLSEFYLCKSHLQKWQGIFSLLQETNSLSLLFEILFEMVGKGYKGACKWLRLLLPSIRHLKKQWARIELADKEKNSYKTKRQIMKYKCRSNDSTLIIPLEMYKPPSITLEMMKNVLMNPEGFTAATVVEYLKLVKPPLTRYALYAIEDLIALYLPRKRGNMELEPEKKIENRVFTVEDLDEMRKVKASLDRGEITDSDAVYASEDLVVPYLPKEGENAEGKPEQKIENGAFAGEGVDEMEKTKGSLDREETTESDGWARSSIDVNVWVKCPLGLLPFQTEVDCSLPEDLTWERITTSRKRTSTLLSKHSNSMKRLRQS